MKRIFLLLAPFLLFGNCTNHSKTEIYQSDRENVLDIKNQVHEILIDTPFIGSIVRLFLLDDYLIIEDCRSDDQLIRLFDRQSFDYVKSTGTLGEGPGEIVNIGFIGTCPGSREFYVSDHGKQKIFCYHVDSLLADPLYFPSVKYEMNRVEFPSRYKYMNDTLSIGLIIRPTGNSGYQQSVARWNMQTGIITPMKYTHPQISKKRVVMDASLRYNRYVEGYEYNDLMTLCDLNGHLISNIYGPAWSDKRTNKTSYYRKVAIYKDEIIALFSGENTFDKNGSSGIKVLCPTLFHIFNIHGNYLKTLDVGYHVSDFCCDEENSRLIMNFDDEIQFGYFDLKSVI